MRHIIFAILVAAPTALITWIITRGTLGQPGSRATPQVSATPSDAPTGHTTPSDAPTGHTTPSDAPTGHTTPSDPDTALRTLLAAPIPGFSLSGAVELYDEKGLFEYINGAAPIFIERSFRKLAAVEMVASGGGELTCDIYDMRSAQNAASIYKAEGSANAEPTDLGDEGRTSSMALVFRDGPYYVKLTAFDERAEATLPRLARTLSGRMP